MLVTAMEHSYGINLLTNSKHFSFAVNSPESDRRDLLRELDTMKQLKPHPHVIKLLGCVAETGKLFISIEIPISLT